MTTSDRPAARRLMPLLLALSLSACAATSAPPLPVRPAQIPPPPSELMTPEPSGTYSDAVRELLRQWLQRLTASKPS